MAYLTANYLLTDSGGFGKKKPKQPIVPVSSNVQTPDLIAAKSQPTWENNVKTLAVKGKIMADAKKAEEENWGRDPLWTAPGISTNEKPFSTATAYGRENRDLRQEAETLGIDYDAVWQDGAEKARRSLMKQWNETNETIGEQSPTLGSVLSVGLLPMTVAGAVQMGVSGLLGRTVDPNSPAFQSVNARDALRDGAAKRIAENHGEVWEKRYRDGMSAADAGYGALLAAGGLSGAVDIGSSAAGRYMELIRSGMTPEAAGKLAGVQAAVDALTEFLPADEALGAVVKKSGMMDTLMEWGRKMPAAEKLIQTVTDRTNGALHKLGMDLYDVDLPRDKQKDLIDLTEKLNTFTDEETGTLVRLTSEKYDDILRAYANDASELKSRNMSLEGSLHPVTGVPFEKVRFEFDNQNYQIVAAKFERLGKVQLQPEQYLYSTSKQKKLCNKSILEQINNDESVKSLFTREQIERLKMQKNPLGFVWHHDVIPGNMELVDAELHAKTGHTGGYSIWGARAKHKGG